MAEKYYYNSPYAFSENKVVAHIELEGLESVSIQLRVAKEGPSFGAKQYRANSYSVTVNTADKSMKIDCSGKCGDKSPNLETNKDGSITVKGSMSFGDANGLAAFSVTIKDNSEKDGSMNIQSIVVGDNTRPLEMVASGTTDGEANLTDATLINTVPINRPEGFSLLNSTTPQQGKSNTDLLVKKEKGNDVSIQGAKKNGDKNYKSVGDFNKQQESKKVVNFEK